MWRREPERASDACADGDRRSADTHEFPVWDAAGACLHGAAIAASGSVDDGLAHFDAAIAQYRALKMPPVFWPALLQLNAAMLGMAGRPADGLVRINEALEVIAELPEPQMMSSELLLLKGDAAARAFDRHRPKPRSGSSGPSSAPTSSRRRCSNSARARRSLDSGARRARPNRRGRLLTTAYERFTEGFATVDLTDARRLLDDLAAAR